MTTTPLLVGAALLGLGVLLGLALGARRRPAGPPPASGVEMAALLGPTADSLRRVQEQLREVEKDRAGAYAGLSAQVAALHRASADLGAEARALSGALRAPTVRGRWGEVQLQRIVELAGMVEHCDFDTQVHARAPDGAVRPDMVVRLAGGRHVPVDAKVPLHAFLQSRETSDPVVARRLLADHARALRAHVDALAGKAYWRSFAPAPEFVVLFVPGEALLDAALTVDPGLTEHAFSRQVVIATPATLIALLRTVAFTWRQDTLSRSAETVLAVGRELHERLGTLIGHVNRIGSGLDRAGEAFNAAVGCLESRVLVSARRLAELGVAADELPPAEPLTRHTRRMAANDVVAADGRLP